MKAMTRMLVLLAVISTAMPAVSAVNWHIAVSQGNRYDSNYQAGDRPLSGSGCTSITTDGFTEGALGSGFGQGCKTGSGSYSLTVLGDDTIQDAYIAYKDGGNGDIELTARIPNAYSGSSQNGAGEGIGIRESTSATSFVAQCKSLQVGTNAVQCQYGSNGTYTAVNCTASGSTRPVYPKLTYDKSATDIRGWTSTNGSSWTECFQHTRSLSDDIVYIIAGARSLTTSFSATLDNFALASTISVYTPVDPTPNAPTLTSAIPDQTGVQGTAFSLTFSAYFSGATSYSLGSAFPGALTESSDGVLSGTPNAADVSSSPYSRNLCATNASGTTCDSVGFSFSASTGDTLTSADVGDSTSTDINCATFESGGAVDPGDIIELEQGSRGAVRFRNCHGNASARITIRKQAGATQLTITGGGTLDGKTPQQALACEDCTYVTIDGTVNWTGHATGCGVNITATGISETPLTDCAIKIDASNQFGVKWLGQAQFVTYKGIEIDGNWPVATNLNGIDTGVSPNDQSYCVSTTPSLLNREFREGLRFERSYVHHTAKELFYMGPNVGFGNCTGATETPRLKDFYFGYNFGEFGGWDCFNLKSAFTGTNVVEYNFCGDIGGGTASSGANSVGFSLFESEGIVRYNKVRRTNDPPGGANGITAGINQAPSAWGTLDAQVYGNDIADVDGVGINFNRSSVSGVADRSGAIYSNTVVDSGGRAINVDTDVHGGVTVSNNVTSDATSTPINVPSGNGNSSTNNLNCAVGACGFVDDDNDGNPNDNDYRITSGSAARNAGSTCPSVDIVGTSRPQGAACDQGAYEFDE